MAQVFKPESITEKTAYATVRIKTNAGTGTGFLFQRSLNNQQIIPVIITNKHVIDGAKNAEIIFHISKNGMPSGETIAIKIDNFKSCWIFHNVANIDLCAMPIASLMNKIKEKYKKDIFIHFLDESIIPNNEQLKQLSCTEQIMMIGYPNGLSDEVNNYPIFRRGFTATHPYIDFSGKKEFVVDMACFPGSSGSPIFMLDTGPYISKEGTTIIGQTRFYFLGILYAGPQISSTGKIIIKDIPTNFELIPDIKNMMHLGYAIKSSEVINLMNQIEAENGKGTN